MNFRYYLLPIFFLIFFIFFFQNVVFSDYSLSISLENHLDKNKLSMINSSLQEHPNTLILMIDSRSADLDEVLNTAKTLFDYKKNHHLNLIVYIKNAALGPSAILPFLSDELYTSPFAIWGDILLGSEEIMGKNVLKSEILSLIPYSKDQNKLLQWIAFAMVDSAQKAQLIDIIQKKNLLDKNIETILANDNESLVLNQTQIEQLNLSGNSISIESFQKKYALNTIQSQFIPKDTLNESFSNYIKFNADKNVIGHIAINQKNDSISQATWIYFKSALDYYKKIKPSFIILELNTPGGEVYAAQLISDALKEMDQENHIPIIAYINDWAISAGAMIAYSCRYITTVENGSMGAAEPVIINQDGGMQSASEKVNSALRKDFGNRARFFGRNADIAEAMVDKDVILVYRNNKIIRLDSKEQIRIKGPNPDHVISNESKLLTLNGEEMIKYGVADLILNKNGLIAITEKEKMEGKWPFSKEALSKENFFKKIPNAEVDAYRMDWKTNFFSFLATPLMSSILMLGLILGFYLEISTPGFGLPGGISLLCLILIIISNLSLEIANTLEIIFIFVGLSLILIEIFIFPTVGIIAVIGGIFFIGGLFAVMLPNIGKIDFEIDTYTLNAAGEEFFKRLAILSSTLVLAFVIIVILAYYFTPSWKMLNRFILKGGEQESALGYVSVKKLEEYPQKGSKGKALSSLRPSGKIMIHQKIFDAMSDGEFIEEKEDVIVENIEGSVIIVRKLTEC